jgi:hypothetical protein
MSRTYNFEVEGRTQFPLDMLRYDACWPEGQEDVSKIHSLMETETRMQMRREGKLPARIRLCSNTMARTTARWNSVGWRVVGADVSGRKS